MSPENYLAALTIAEKNVKHQKSIASYASGSRLQEKIRNFVGVGGYRVGDSWDIAAYYAQSAQMRMMSPDPTHPAPKGLAGLFRYEVVEVEPSAISVAVTQLSEDGIRIVDPRIEKVLFRFDGGMHQLSKEYVFRKDLKTDGEPVAVSPNGLRSRMTQLELFALDVPELGAADKSTLKAESLPQLPHELAKVAERSGWKARVRAAAAMEQDDFFGRQVQMLWRRGDPWPAYLQTSMGTSILIRRGGE